MSTSVIINGESFSIPTQGENPPWGEDLSALLLAMVNSLNSVQGISDILLTSFTIVNNQSSAANVFGCLFDTSTVRSAIIEYSVYRSSSVSELSEVGHIYVTYKSTAASWEIVQNYAGSSEVNFTITSGGQLQYTSTNFAGTGYVGKMKFTARAFLQT